MTTDQPSPATTPTLRKYRATPSTMWVCGAVIDLFGCNRLYGDQTWLAPVLFEALPEEIEIARQLWAESNLPITIHEEGPR